MRTWLVCLCLALAAAHAWAAEFNWNRTGTRLRMVGEIRSGDTDRLLALVKAQEFFGLELDSPGGSVVEALRLQALVKALYVHTSVAPQKSCASSCFLVFLAGSGRSATGVEIARGGSVPQDELAGAPGIVGLHRPYLKSLDSLDNQQDALMRAIRSRLDGDMVPRRLVDLMMSQPSNAIYWLTDDDLQELAEYPPNQEEFFIAKCGYDRQTRNRLVDAPDRQQTQQMIAEMDRQTDCIVEHVYEARKAAFAKVRAGWVPPGVVQ